MIAYKLVSYDLLNPNIQDGVLLDTYAGVNLGITSCTFEVRINDAGNMQFTMSRAHPAINDIQMYDTTIGLNMRYIDSNGTVQDEWWPFVGRVISISRDMYGNKSFSCEGCMNFLNDAYMAYWDHKSENVRYFIQPGIDSYNRIKRAIEPYLSRIIWFNTNKGHGLNNPFSFSKEYDKDNRNETYMKVLDGIQDKVINPYGGVLYFIAYPYYNSEFHSMEFRIEMTYYDRIDIGFDYNTATNTFPDEYTYMPGEYGGPVPCFGIADNITNITEQPVKTDIWTGVMAIGEGAITKMGDPHDITADDVYWINQSGAGGFVGYTDRIVKAVEFSEVKKGDSSGTELVAKSEEYVNRFANLNYFTMRNYTINGIEPCEVFGGVTKIVKPGFPVIIDYEYDEGTTSCPCISIKHDVFDISGSEYECGPIIPQNIINEDISTWK